MKKLSILMSLLLLCGSVAAPVIASAVDNEPEILAADQSTEKAVKSGSAFTAGSDVEAIIADLKDQDYLVAGSNGGLVVSEAYVQDVQAQLGADYTVRSENNSLVIVENSSLTRSGLSRVAGGETKIVFSLKGIEIYLSNTICRLLESGLALADLLLALLPTSITAIITPLIDIIQTQLLDVNEGNGIIITLSLMFPFISVTPQGADDGSGGSGGSSTPIAVESIIVWPASQTMTVGETLQLVPIISPMNASNQKVSWTSSNTTVATVTDTGLVTALAEGTTTVEVKTADGNKTATCTITVKNGEIAVTDIVVTPTSKNLKIGDTQQLKANIYPANATNQTVRWLSRDENIASVSDTGLVTALAKGTATIEASTEDGNRIATSTITVESDVISVTDITITPANKVLDLGQTQQLKANVSPVNATNKTVVWHSRDENIASVSASGLVTALTEGVATIEASTADGNKIATSTITVKDGAVSVTDVTVTPVNASLMVREKQQLKANVSPANATNRKVVWHSRNQNIASVSDSGEVTALAEGTATIEVSSVDGNKIATCTVIVKKAPSVEIQRLYNPNSGEHFYTPSVSEKNSLVAVGWLYEGVGWYAPKSGKKVHRLYNPNAGDHHYTLDLGEKEALEKLGWLYEGSSWYSDVLETVPLYRSYNPNAQTGAHNYTPSLEEHDYLVSIGWQDEDIAWYGVNP